MASEREPQIGSDEICEWIVRDVAPGRPALFLDRDGVLVEEVNYLHRAEDVRLHDGARELVRAANEAGVPVVVITNQAGIGRGYYGWDEFLGVERAISELLVPARLDAVFACPFHVDGRAPYNVDDHPDRKPNPGMLERAHRLLGVDLSRSWLVGDAASDVEAAVNAGLAGAVHLLTGHGERDRAAVEAIATRETDLVMLDALGESPELQRVLEALAG